MNLLFIRFDDCVFGFDDGLLGSDLGVQFLRIGGSKQDLRVAVGRSDSESIHTGLRGGKLLEQIANLGILMGEGGWGVDDDVCGMCGCV